MAREKCEDTQPSSIPEDWVVVCAVRCEPVSIPNSLLTAKITGNFSNLATLGDSSYAKTHALQRLQCRFATQITGKIITGSGKALLKNRDVSEIQAVGGSQPTAFNYPQKWASCSRLAGRSRCSSFRRCPACGPDGRSAHGNFSTPI